MEKTQSHEGTKIWTLEEVDKKTNVINGLAIEVHKICGPGLLERIYRDCLLYELKIGGFEARSEVPIVHRYKSSDTFLDFRIDILVDNCIVLELKSVPHLLPVHESQLISYLRLSGLPCGLLLNFYVPILAQGIKRKYNYTVLKSNKPITS